MKKNKFNKYVDYICEELSIKKRMLFSKTKASKVSTARFLLYTMCIESSIKVVEIVDLMSRNGYNTGRGSVEYGLKKIDIYNDIDKYEFIKKII